MMSIARSPLSRVALSVAVMFALSACAGDAAPDDQAAAPAAEESASGSFVTVNDMHFDFEPGTLKCNRDNGLDFSAKLPSESLLPSTVSGTFGRPDTGDSLFVTLYFGDDTAAEFHIFTGLDSVGEASGDGFDYQYDVAAGAASGSVTYNWTDEFGGNSTGTFEVNC